MDLITQFMTTITAMPETELRLLNSAVCDELKRRRDLKDHLASVALAVGDKVYFDGKRGRVSGVITQINPKTIYVEQRNGGYPVQWKVSPSLLKRLPSDYQWTKPNMVITKL